MGRRGSESELARLKQLAREHARERRETTTTAHLLAAVVGSDGPARALLEARKLDGNTLLASARALEEPADASIDRAFNGARELARRAPTPAGGAALQAAEPRAIHLLVALLSDRSSVAYRALVKCGVDAVRLRTAATRVALGLVAPPRRDLAQDHRARAAALPPSRAASAPSPAARRPRERSTAVAVPLFPPPERPRPSPRSAPAEDAATRSGAGSQARDQRTEPGSPRPFLLELAAEEAVVVSTHEPHGCGFEGDAGDEPPPLGLDPLAFPTLSALGRNLTAAALAGELDPVIGREHEVEQALDVLAKRHGNSPLLVGPAGVGKTCVAWAIAERFGRQDPPRALLEISLTDLLAGTDARGALAERAACIRREVARAGGQIVLFIDQTHELLDGSAEELLAELRTALARGELPLVGASTPEALRRLMENDQALARRLTVVEVSEPDEPAACAILRSVADALERHHGVALSDEAIAGAVTWSKRYLPGRALPDKAVALLDLAGARAARRTGERTVEPVHVAHIVSELASVPVARLMQTDQERMVRLHELLAERVVGHADPLERIAAVLRRNAAGLRSRRPIGSFLLLGPTGVGKTETAKAIAHVLFGSPDAMTRLDMSEYAEAHAVARLVGAPPGYIGHEAGGLLTEAIKRRPYQVVLLDELEKAHRDVIETFLQVFDEGRLTDGRGRLVDCTNTVIVLTSNLGAAEMVAASTSRRVGFSGSRADPGQGDRELGEVARQAARAALPPELYNRLDEVLFFAPLSRDDVRLIGAKLLGDLRETLEERGVGLDLDEAVLDALLDAGGFEPALGARPLRRAVGRLIEAPLADMMLRGELERGTVALVGVGDEGEVTVDAVTRRQAGPRRRQSAAG